MAVQKYGSSDSEGTQALMVWGGVMARISLDLLDAKAYQRWANEASEQTSIILDQPQQAK